MEEILVLVLQLIAEVVIQALIYGGFDLIAFTVRKGDKADSPGCALMVVFGLIGTLLGVIANWIHPRPLLPEAWMRLTNLILAPILVGGLSFLIADWRRKRSETLITPTLHFWLAFCFVLGFDVVRFVYGQRLV